MSSFDYTKTHVFFRDSFVPFNQANLSIASSPVLYGLCVYTVCNVTWDSTKKQLYLFRPQDHYQRLVNSAKIMDFHSFAADWPYERFVQTLTELVTRNKIKQDSLVRSSIFIDELAAGTRIHDLQNSFSAYVYPMLPVLSADGIHACVSSWQRTPDNAIPSRAKVNGSYANASLMKNEALLNGYDEAIAIDEHGHVAESTVANIFLVRDGVLLTPDFSADLLEGITRDSIIQLARTLDIPVQERSIDRSELYIADEIFLSGSSANAVPVLSVDKRPVGAQAGTPKPGTITKRLMKAFDDAQHGRDPRFKDWLALIN